MRSYLVTIRLVKNKKVFKNSKCGQECGKMEVLIALQMGKECLMPLLDGTLAGVLTTCICIFFV